MRTEEIENLIAREVFPVRRYIVVPRIAWGLDGVDHECDLLAMSSSGVLQEIEIKISRSDLLAEKRKNHSHGSKTIRRLWFAVPAKMRDFALLHIPAEAGLISCSDDKQIYRKCEIVRRPRLRVGNKARPGMGEKMARLGLLRYWSLRFAFEKNQKRLVG